MKTLKGLKNKTNLLIIRAKINKDLTALRRYSHYVNYKPVGQKITIADPYGEENWAE